MLNYAAIHGRLSCDPEIRRTQSGVSVCNFTVAVDRSYTKQGEGKQTDFFTVVCWRGLADMVSKYFTRGKEILVTGEMQSRKWQDKDGNKRVSWELMANSVDFCGSKGDSSGGGNAPAQAAPAASTEGFTDLSENDEELPF